MTFCGTFSEIRPGAKMVYFGTSSNQQNSDQQKSAGCPTLSTEILIAGSGQCLNILHDIAQDLESVTTDLRKDTDSPAINKEFAKESIEDQRCSLQSGEGLTSLDTFPGDLCVCMGPNGEVFNSAYTDTITSVSNMQFLIKPSNPDSAAISAKGEAKQIFFNSGCVGLLNHDSDGHVFSDGHENKVISVITTSEESFEELKSESHETVTDSRNLFHHIEEFFHEHLIPVDENEVFSLDIEEITPSETAEFSPSSCTKITSNLIAVDESFLLQSQSSLYSEDMKHDKRAVTMQNLHERSSFLDLTNVEKMGRACQRALIYLKDDLTFGSLASLNNLAAKNLSNPDQEISLIDGTRNVDIIPSTKHRRNVIALSISITLLFIAMGSVRNLQSSLNQEGGVGIISMAVSFVGYMLGSIFSSSIVQNFQPRRCIIISLIPNLIYVAANIYPTLWLMTAVSLIQGISLAVIWNAMSTYITFLSRGCALKKSEDFEKVSSNFFGIFCLIYQSYHIIGNLIASLVLMPGSQAATSTFVNTTVHNFTAITNHQEDRLFESDGLVPVMFETDSASKINYSGTPMDASHLHFCGAEFCNHFEMGGSGVSVSDSTKYMLFGIYMGCIVVSIAIAAFLLEPLNQCLFFSTSSLGQKMKLQLISLAKFSVDVLFLLLLPILMYSIMQFGFISGEVTMVSLFTCLLH